MRNGQQQISLMKKNNSMWLLMLVLVLVLVVTFASGCGGIPPTYYYRVDYTAAGTDGGTHLPVSLGVAQFDADILYQSDKIVYRQSQYEARFYHYRRWVAPPRKIVTEKVMRHYQRSGVFDRVVHSPTNQKIDYLLKGNILAFEEWDQAENWFGIVTIEFALHAIETNEIVWEKVFSEKTGVREKKPVEVVRAISESLNKVITASIHDVKHYLTNTVE